MLGLVLLLVTGCTTISGAPTPAEPASPTSAATTRPRDVPIDDVDPCTLLTAEQRGDLGLDGQPVLDRSPSLLFPGVVTMCVVRGFNPRALVVSVGLVTTAGIEFIANGQLAAEFTPLAIEGFPAVLGRPSQYDQFCNVFVDVAPGQLMDVQALDGGRQPPVPQDQLCQDAERAAVAAVKTLLSAR